MHQFTQLCKIIVSIGISYLRMSYITYKGRQNLFAAPPNNAALAISFNITFHFIRIHTGNNDTRLCYLQFCLENPAGYLYSFLQRVLNCQNDGELLILQYIYQSAPEIEKTPPAFISLWNGLTRSTKIILIQALFQSLK